MEVYFMNTVSNSNPIEALDWLSQGKDIGLKENKFFCYGWKDKATVFLHLKSERKEVQKIIDFIQGNLQIASNEGKQEWLTLSNVIIKKYASNRNVGKIVTVFDREIVKQGDEVTFSHPKNQASFKKWKNYGMPEALYQRHPEFCTFLETSGLLSQMKVTRDVPKEIDGEPALTVDGQWMKWSHFKNAFEAVHSPKYNETFIVKKETRDVYTYLDNGKGLQPHHPYLTELSPISKLNDEEYQKVLEKAHCFIRSNETELTDNERNKRNEERPFIIQIVSSHIDGPQSKASRLLYRSKHPYLRLIVGKDNPQLNIRKGDVYEVGYGWKNKVPLPLIASQGQFRSPDLWEYKASKEKIVTNIPVSKDEAHAFYRYTQRYFRDGVNLGKAIGFHLVDQNCSTYVRASLQSAGITVPTEIAVNDLIHEIAPNWVRNIGAALGKAKEMVSIGVVRTIALLPPGLREGCQFIAAKIAAWSLKFFETITAFCLVPLKTALGGILGKGGVAFAFAKESKDKIDAELTHWKAWFRLSRYRFNLPGILQRWQREQESTFISNNSVRLAIVPA